MSETLSPNKRSVKYWLNRYFVQGMSAMALGLFSSLIIGLIISQIGKIPGLNFLTEITEVLSASSPVVGAARRGNIMGLEG